MAAQFQSSTVLAFVGWGRFRLWGRWQELMGTKCCSVSSHLQNSSSSNSGGGCCKDTTACQVSHPQRGAWGEEAEDTFIWGVAAPATSRYLAPAFWWDSQSSSVKQQFAPRTQSGAHLLIPQNSHQTIMTFSQCCSFEQMRRGERICIPLLAPWTS